VPAYSAQAPFLMSCRSSHVNLCQYVLTEELWNQFSLLLIFTEIGCCTPSHY